MKGVAMREKTAESKKRAPQFRFLLWAFLLQLPIMFILSFYSVDTYSIIKNTTSHLGAQEAVNAWIMNASFIIVGVSCLIEAWLYLREFWFHKIVLSVFALGLIFTAIFRHVPIIKGVSFDPLEDALHSVFATIVGFSFTVFAVSAAFIEKETRHRAMDVTVGLVATALSALMFYLPDYSGIWQRAIFIISFTWLIFTLERIKKFKKQCNDC